MNTSPQRINVRRRSSTNISFTIDGERAGASDLVAQTTTAASRSDTASPLPLNTKLVSSPGASQQSSPVISAASSPLNAKAEPSQRRSGGGGILLSKFPGGGGARRDSNPLLPPPPPRAQEQFAMVAAGGASTSSSSPNAGAAFTSDFMYPLLNTSLEAGGTAGGGGDNYGIGSSMPSSLNVYYGGGLSDANNNSAQQSKSTAPSFSQYQFINAAYQQNNGAGGVGGGGMGLSTFAESKHRKASTATVPYDPSSPEASGVFGATSSGLQRQRDEGSNSTEIPPLAFSAVKTATSAAAAAGSGPAVLKNSDTSDSGGAATTRQGVNSEVSSSAKLDSDRSVLLPTMAHGTGVWHDHNKPPMAAPNNHTHNAGVGGPFDSNNSPATSRQLQAQLVAESSSTAFSTHVKERLPAMTTPSLFKTSVNNNNTIRAKNDPTQDAASTLGSPNLRSIAGCLNINNSLTASGGAVSSQQSQVSFEPAEGSSSHNNFFAFSSSSPSQSRRRSSSSQSNGLMSTLNSVGVVNSTHHHVVASSGESPHQSRQQSPTALHTTSSMVGARMVDRQASLGRQSNHSSSGVALRKGGSTVSSTSAGGGGGGIASQSQPQLMMQQQKAAAAAALNEEKLEATRVKMAIPVLRRHLVDQLKENTRAARKTRNAKEEEANSHGGAAGGNAVASLLFSGGDLGESVGRARTIGRSTAVSFFSTEENSEGSDKAINQTQKLNSTANLIGILHTAPPPPSSSKELTSTVEHTKPLTGPLYDPSDALDPALVTKRAPVALIEDVEKDPSALPAMQRYLSIKDKQRRDRIVSEHSKTLVGEEFLLGGSRAERNQRLLKANGDGCESNDDATGGGGSSPSRSPRSPMRSPHRTANNNQSSPQKTTPSTATHQHYYRVGSKTMSGLVPTASFLGLDHHTLAQMAEKGKAPANTALDGTLLGAGGGRGYNWQSPFSSAEKNTSPSSLMVEGGGAAFVSSVAYHSPFVQKVLAPLLKQTREREKILENTGGGEKEGGNASPPRPIGFNTTQNANSPTTARSHGQHSATPEGALPHQHRKSTTTTTTIDNTSFASTSFGVAMELLQHNNDHSIGGDRGVNQTTTSAMNTPQLGSLGAGRSSKLRRPSAVAADSSPLGGFGGVHHTISTLSFNSSSLGRVAGGAAVQSTMPSRRSSTTPQQNPLSGSVGAVVVPSGFSATRALLNNNPLQSRNQQQQSFSSFSLSSAATREQQIAEQDRLVATVLLEEMDRKKKALLDALDEDIGVKTSVVGPSNNAMSSPTNTTVRKSIAEANCSSSPSSVPLTVVTSPTAQRLGRSTSRRHSVLSTSAALTRNSSMAGGAFSPTVAGATATTAGKSSSSSALIPSMTTPATGGAAAQTAIVAVAVPTATTSHATSAHYSGLDSEELNLLAKPLLSKLKEKVAPATIAEYNQMNATEKEHPWLVEPYAGPSAAASPLRRPRTIISTPNGTISSPSQTTASSPSLSSSPLAAAATSQAAMLELTTTQRALAKLRNPQGYDKQYDATAMATQHLIQHRAGERAAEANVLGPSSSYLYSAEEWKERERKLNHHKAGGLNAFAGRPTAELRIDEGTLLVAAQRRCGDVFASRQLALKIKMLEDEEDIRRREIIFEAAEEARQKAQALDAAFEQENKWRRPYKPRSRC